MASTDSPSAQSETARSEKAALRSRIRRARRERRRAQTDPAARHAESRAVADAVLSHLDSSAAAAEGGWGTPQATVAVFRSTPSEPDTSALIAALHDRGVTVLVPRTREDMWLEWHRLYPAEERPASDTSAVAGDHTCVAAGDRASDTAQADHGASQEAPAPAPTPNEAAVSSAAELPSTDDTADEGPSLGCEAVSDITAMIQPGLAVDTSGHRLGQGGGCYDRTVPLMRPSTVRAVLLFDDEILEAVPHTDLDQPVPAVVTPEGGWRQLR